MRYSIGVLIYAAVIAAFVYGLFNFVVVDAGFSPW